MLGWMWEHYASLGLMAGSRPSRNENGPAEAEPKTVSIDRSRAACDQKISSRRMMIGIGIPISHRSKPLNIAFSIRREVSWR
jgi:hypothetical protein